MTFTPPGNPAGGAELLRSPASGPPPFSLLTVLDDLGPLLGPGLSRTQDGLPLLGVRLDHQRCAKSVQLDNCPGDRAYPVAGDESLLGEHQEDDHGWPFYPFQWYSPVGCDFTAPNYQHLAELAAQDVTAATAWQVSHQLWTGESNADTPYDSPSLATAAVPLDGDPSSAAEGVALLIAAKRQCDHAGARTLLHVDPVLVPDLRDTGTLTEVGSQLRGPSGEYVSLGPGYSGGDDPGASSAFIYISGPVYATLGTPWDPANPTGAPGVPEGVSNPRRNENEVFAVRRAIFALDTCCVFRITVPAPSGDGGS